MILDGELASSSRIEEVGIADRLGVSRTPVREALIALEQEGLVSSRPNRGFVVSPADRALVVEAFPILGALESAALRISGDRLRAHLTTLDEQIQALADAHTRPAQYEHDHAFHELLTRDCGNPRLLKLLQAERTRVRRFDGMHERGVADLEGTCREHSMILSAITKANYDEASQLLIEHWERGTEVVLKWLDQRDS